MNRVWLQIAVSAVAMALAGCGKEREREETDVDAAPAAAAGQLQLTEERQEHLGLEVQPAFRRKAQASLTTSGWVETVPGSEVVVKSPVTGFVRFERGAAPAVGRPVQKGKTLSTMLVFLGPQEIAQLVSAKEETDIAIEQSLVSMKLAEEQLTKLKSARDAVAGTRINELQEIYGRAKAAYRESQDKLPFLLKEPYDVNSLAKPVAVEAPLSGRVTQMHVAPDQFVVQGDPLWTIADWSTLWVRVPIFEADLPHIRREESAQLEIHGTQITLAAAPLALPIATKPGLRTIDLFYEIANREELLREGQSLSVRLAIEGPADAEDVVVPLASVLWDEMGNAWIYVRTDDETFRRQRIELGAATKDGTVVTRGLTGNEQIVVSGAASLYGEEFKGSIAAEDDD